MIATETIPVCPACSALGNRQGIARSAARQPSAASRARAREGNCTRRSQSVNVTETIACPMCRHAGDDGRPHELQPSTELWRCGRCGWTFKITEHGTEHWINPYVAARRRQKQHRHRRRVRR